MFILPAYGPETGFQFVLIAVAGVDQHQLHIIDYLREENQFVEESIFSPSFRQLRCFS